MNTAIPITELLCSYLQLNLIFERKNIMKNFLNKYNATKIETTKDEGKLSLDSCKKRILSILDENMRNFKKDTWNVGNRMNKLIVDT